MISPSLVELLTVRFSPPVRVRVLVLGNAHAAGVFALVGSRILGEGERDIDRGIGVIGDGDIVAGGFPAVARGNIVGVILGIPGLLTGGLVGEGHLAPLDLDAVNSGCRAVAAVRALDADGLAAHGGMGAVTDCRVGDGGKTHKKHQGKKRCKYFSGFHFGMLLCKILYFKTLCAS